MSVGGRGTSSCSWESYGDLTKRSCNPSSDEGFSFGVHFLLHVGELSQLPQKIFSTWVCVKIGGSRLDLGGSPVGCPEASFNGTPTTKNHHTLASFWRLGSCKKTHTQQRLVSETVWMRFAWIQEQKSTKRACFKRNSW